MSANERKSSDTAKKWLIGCGIGCGAIILILIILGTGGYFFFRNMVEGFRDTEAMMSTLTERFGRIEDFCPEPDGAIKPERIETFLSVRAIFAPARQKLEMSFEALRKGNEEAEIEVRESKNVIKMISLGLGLLPQISELLKSRNQALLDKEMGMGEYYFIYAVSYYSWLKKSPEEGPDVQLMDFDRREDYRDRREWLEMRRDLTLKRVNRQILPMLRNQLEKLVESDKSGVQVKWRKKLEAEVEAMESDRVRIPWQEGLPTAIEASLRPFKERLEASYSIMTNSLEMTMEQRESAPDTKKQNSK